MADRFWDLTAGREDATALIDAATDAQLSYGALRQQCTRFAERVAQPHKQLAMLTGRSNMGTVVAYLGLLRAGHAVWWVDPAMAPATLNTLLDCYQPRFRVDVRPGAGHEPPIEVAEPRPGDSTGIHPDLAQLLATSGSTGSPRLARLSHTAIASNAAAIASYLGLQPDDCAPTVLPLHYAYGASVLTSHLAAGATTLLTEESLVSRGFWDMFRRHEATSLSGVPWTWQTLKQLRLERMDLPSLRTMTQAGGRLAPALVTHFAQMAAERSQRFFVMYGQTEATARIAYVPPDQVLAHPGRIGVAIPGGSLQLGDPDESGSRELIYVGPNVMMGYADSAGDLARGDDLGGRLHTGDLATVDATGLYTVVGRRKRFLKISGKRIGLDHLEATLAARLDTAVVCGGTDDALRVVVEGDAEAAARAHTEVRTLLGLHPRLFTCQHREHLPRNARGKVEWATLQSEADIE